MNDFPAGLNIRPMTAGDLESVLTIAADAPEVPHWQPSVYLAALEPESAPRRIALAAELEGRLAGFAVVSTVAPQAELESIAVALSARRRGLARALLSEIAARLRALGVRELLLEVRASNQAALELYGGCGFESVAVRARYYSDPVEDAVLMNANLL